MGLVAIGQGAGVNCPYTRPLLVALKDDADRRESPSRLRILKLARAAIKIPFDDLLVVHVLVELLLAAYRISCSDGLDLLFRLDDKVAVSIVHCNFGSSFSGEFLGHCPSHPLILGHNDGVPVPVNPVIEDLVRVYGLCRDKSALTAPKKRNSHQKTSRYVHNYTKLTPIFI